MLAFFFTSYEFDIPAFSKNFQAERVADNLHYLWFGAQKYNAFSCTLV